ncbi:hypothetical protein ACRAWD_20120 [Caulobacter segnis]
MEGRLRPGALIVADNADYAPDYMGRVRSPMAGYLSTPFAEDGRAVDEALAAAGWPRTGRGAATRRRVRAYGGQGRCT